MKKHSSDVSAVQHFRLWLVPMKTEKEECITDKYYTDDHKLKENKKCYETSTMVTISRLIPLFIPASTLEYNYSNGTASYDEIGTAVSTFYGFPTVSSPKAQPIVYVRNSAED